MSLQKFKELINNHFTLLEVVFINHFVDDLPCLIVFFIILHRNNTMLLVYLNCPLINNYCCRNNTRFVIVACMLNFTNIVNVYIRLCCLLLRIVSSIMFFTFNAFFSINWNHQIISNPMVCLLVTTPWIGPGAWKSWRGTASGPGPENY